VLAGKKYEPKWKKKETLGDSSGTLDPTSKGLTGTIPVVFRQGNVTKTTMAMPNQPLRDVAIQSGQFINYGCRKGECGTCEALCDGKWIRPCVALVPAAISDGGDYVISVKEVKSKAKSSGKFYSVRSFFMGFWNNLLGMVGFVKWTRKARKNWRDRLEYEDNVQALVAKKKAERERKRQSNLAGKDP